MGRQHEGVVVERRTRKRKWRKQPFLPDELILEILLRLPGRSLVKFRRVCNSWRNLISTPQFANRHLQRCLAHPSLTHPRGGCVYFSLPSTQYKMGVFSIPSLLDNPSAPTKVASLGRSPHRRRVIGSCNGLLCVYELLPYPSPHSRALLWNPCTGSTSQWLELQETSRLLSVNGFGYDHIHNKYKLFLSLKLRPGGADGFVSRIFTFGDNQWRTIQDFPFNFHDGVGVFVSGALNWVHCSKNQGGEEGRRKYMLGFLDLGEESYGRLPLPDIGGEEGGSEFTPSLGVLSNCLALGVDREKTHWVVWVMKEYGVHQSWTKLASIPHDPLHPTYYSRSLHPLYISHNHLLVATALSSNSPWSKLVVCDSNSGTCHFPLLDSSSDGMLHAPLPHLVGRRSFCIYHETLVSPSRCGLPLSTTPLIKPRK